MKTDDIRDEILKANAELTDHDKNEAEGGNAIDLVLRMLALPAMALAGLTFLISGKIPNFIYVLSAVCFAIAGAYVLCMSKRRAKIKERRDNLLEELARSKGR